MAIDQVELGKRLKQARENCGMTQDQVAREMELARATIAQIETGLRSVSGLELSRSPISMRVTSASSYRMNSAPIVLRQFCFVRTLVSTMAFRKHFATAWHSAGTP